MPREVRRQKLSDERTKAIAAILERGGLKGLAEFAKAVESPYKLGLATASAQAALLQPDDLLLRHLADPRDAPRQLAFGYAQGRVHGDGEDWVVRQLERADLQLTARQRVELLLALPPAANTWRVATACGEDIAREYWRRVAPGYVEDDDLAEAISCLVAAGRPYMAADLIAFTDRVNEGIVPAELVAELLSAATSATGEYDTPGANFGSNAGFLLDALKSADYDRAALARLEWRLMPALSYHERSPDALHRLMAEDPGFFVEILSLVFPAEGEDRTEVSRQDRLRATSAYSVLESWQTIPGQGGRGEVDGAELRRWIDSAIPALETAGRTKIGHQMIGQMLSGGLQDGDGTWPCTPIRNVIEELRSTHLEAGLCTGVYNSRGLVTKDPSEGGASERALAEQYEGYATAVRASHPRTAGALRRIGQWYREEASQEDFESQMWEEL